FTAGAFTPVALRAVALDVEVRSPARVRAEPSAWETSTGAEAGEATGFAEPALLACPFAFGAFAPFTPTDAPVPGAPVRLEDLPFEFALAFTLTCAGVEPLSPVPGVALLRAPALAGAPCLPEAA